MQHLCTKPLSLHQYINNSVSSALAPLTCTFPPFLSLLSLLFPKPSDILCYILGASIDQSPLRIKQRAAYNPYGNKQGLSLTETRFCAEFSAAYQTWFKGSFWFHKEISPALPPVLQMKGEGEKNLLGLPARKGRRAFLKLWETLNIPMLHVLFVVSRSRQRSFMKDECI